MDIFGSSSIAGIKLKNRIIRSATHEGHSDSEGRPMQGLTDLYKRLAKGGAGAIITGLTGIQRNGKCTYNMRFIDDDRFIDDYGKLNAELKGSGTPIIMQLVHCGARSSRAIAGVDPVAPSRFRDAMYGSVARELGEKEIEEIIDSFVRAVVRAKKSGFDGVQLHAAHGYLLFEFLSRHVNKRRDRWGGPLENRFRILSEIFERSRAEVGAYPILVKLSAYDGDRNGMRIDEGVRVAAMLQSAGADAIEVSCGGLDDGINTIRSEKLPLDAIMSFVPMFRGMPPFKKKIFRAMAPLMLKRHSPVFTYNVPAAEAIKKNVDIPVIAVGGIRSMPQIHDILDNGRADYVSMSRPFIIEPDIVNRFREGKQEESRCINCGYCLFGVMTSDLKCYRGKIRQTGLVPAE